MRADESPVIADFGICHMDGLERVTLTDEAMGPINYIAPEMESGRRFGKPTDKTDAYSLGKVLYWMLSGGRIFARENHRDVSLTEVLNDQGFEHIHMLLDRVLIENPAQRISATDFLTGLTQARSLISGHFAPLTPSIGIRCRFCGIGTYSPHRMGSPIGDELSIKSPKTGTYSLTIKALMCGNCGHVEFFGSHLTPKWWGK